jgi:dUTP pyrophosphatase
MANFLNNQSADTLNLLLNIYDKVMVLKVFVDEQTNDNLKYKYYEAAANHNNKLLTNPEHIDAGFDLITPGNEPNEANIYGIENLPFTSQQVNKIDFKVKCSARMFSDTGKQFNTGYYIHPRSSLSKTHLRLANSTGIIDAGYRGHLIGMFDVINSTEYWGKMYERYLQICAPGLVPIFVEIVDNLNEETARGANGFGSTG